MPMLTSQTRVGVVGAGAMGRGIAQVAAAAGIASCSATPSRARPPRGRRASRVARARVARGSWTSSRRSTIVARIADAGELSAGRPRLRRLRPGDRGDRRGPRRQAGAVRALGRAWSPDRDPRDQHVVARHRRDRRRLSAARARHRHALLQSGAGDAARRDHPGDHHCARGRAARACAGRHVGQDDGRRDGHAGLHRQPGRAAVLRRGASHRRGGHRRLRDDRLGDARRSAASAWGRSS